ncbi:zwei Ig domain protein zig-8-like isoform X2 [Leptopilina boulardi]|uniref:zwei Ig domain protein zig-8-like isoform X2 n=1 Tax=Leptopilina boulardi TaxID=63433 RepID=UPI0021F54EB3|nr:zwei Ig domain protein zig-8-like isoform X2 [Leptopilina boulardi]
MASLPRVVLVLLGIAYLLRADSSFDNDIMAGLSIPDDYDESKEDNTDGDDERYTTRMSKNLVQEVTAIVGQITTLLCNFEDPGNRTVSWIRKKDLQILTSMYITYTSDVRFKIITNISYTPAQENSSIWNLQIDNVQPRDEGIYECQLSTEPKIHKAIYLKILDVQAKILGPEEVFVKKGSTISLTCIVNAQDIAPSNVTWWHAGFIIDFDSPRGGVSLETEKAKGGTTSKLLITRASLNDSGNYTCVSSKAAPASVIVHVLNGEHPAAMQHGGGNKLILRTFSISLTLILTLVR